jgi:hypothetical protein
MVRDRPNWYLLRETERTNRVVAREGVSRLEREPSHSGSPHRADTNDR